MPLRFLLAFATIVAALSFVAASAFGDSTPIGPLPKGPVSTIQTTKGQLVAVALPRGAAGLVWRIARPLDGKIVRQETEGDVGKTVVLVFSARGVGTTRI